MTVLLIGLGFYLTALGLGALLALVVAVLDRRDRRRARRHGQAPTTNSAASYGTSALVFPFDWQIPEWENASGGRRRGDGPPCPVVSLREYRARRRASGGSAA
jgi:hypothetical protein